MSNTTRDQAGQLINSPSLPGNGADVQIIKGGGGTIDAVMVGSIAVPKSQ